MLALAALVAGGAVFADWWSCLPEEATATYVGRQSCIQCHQPEAELYEGSHHDLAMDYATDETVLGDFNNAELTHDGMTSRMYREDGKFMVHTEGPDGMPGDFEVKYVFGYEPLQQYMVEFDRTPETPAHEVGRVQVLRISWDTEKREWFYLRPPDVNERLAPDDDLHWTGVAQRWNNMCADCHSTNLQKNFDVKTKKYHTTFSEIDVSCEACHGPGSLHVQLANSKSLFWDRRRGYGLAKLKGKDPQAQLDTCFPCHSRRRILKPDYPPGAPFHDYFANELLRAHTYHADGQILDEVYEQGSFTQSKMYHKGVRCTDCHDPHSVRLKQTGNSLCTSCHIGPAGPPHPAGKFDTPIHHRHDPGGKGASCVECHMPQTTYMAVDERRDHSLRVPRPDLSVRLGTPNACTGCHLDRAKLAREKREKLAQYSDWLIAARNDPEVKQALGEIDRWAADHFQQWYGAKPDVETHFANVLAKAREGAPAAAPDLIDIAQDKRLPVIVRATSLYELGRYPPETVLRESAALLSDFDPQVRAAAVANFDLMPDHDELVRLLTPLLDDPVRMVRTEAARVLARVPRTDFSGDQRRKLQAALEELKASLMVNSDRAAAHVNLAILHENLGETKMAEQAYETAIHVEPQVTGPRTNLAALLDSTADEREASARQAEQRGDARATELLQQVPPLRQRAAELRRAELPLLARDAQLAPDSAAIQYRYGLSLHLHGQPEQAEAALARAVQLEPNTPDFTLALALLHRQRGNYDQAITLTERLLELRPDDPANQQLLHEIRQEAAARAGPAR